MSSKGKLNPNPLGTLHALEQSPLGKDAVKRVRNLWYRHVSPVFADLLQHDKDVITPSLAKSVNQAFGVALEKFLGELGDTYYIDAAKDFETSQLPPDQWTQAWLDKFEGRLMLAVEAAAAMAIYEADMAYLHRVSEAKAILVPFDLLPEAAKSETRATYTRIGEMLAEAIRASPVPDVCLRAVTEESIRGQNRSLPSIPLSERSRPPDKVNDESELLQLLPLIGGAKKKLPLALRQWLNELGLFVQSRALMGEEHLKAGGQFRPYFHASRGVPGAAGEGLPWTVHTFDRRTWDRRFASLVWPTFDIALYLGQLFTNRIPVELDGAITTISEMRPDALQKVLNLTDIRLGQAVQHFNDKGEWLAQVLYRCKVCSYEGIDSLQLFRRKCPGCGGVPS